MAQPPDPTGCKAGSRPGRARIHRLSPGSYNRAAMSTAATWALPSPPPRVSSGDRLGLTVFFAIIAHVVIILGVGFSPDDRSRINRNTMEIILVPTRSKAPPEEADYLAQANQEGGGESDSRERPMTPLAAPMVTQRTSIPTVAAPSRPVEPPAPTPSPRKTVLAKTVDTAPQQVKPVEESEAQSPREPRSEPQPRPQPEIADTVDATALVSRSLELASLSAEINRKLKAYAERPRHKFVNARTREYQYAAYMEAWRAKVERVGNLNYPDEARRNKLSGNLLLDVSLRPDGSVKDIVLRRSSGHKVLDDAAIRIVKLASPYEPFPKEIRKETDILHLERTWQFLSSNQLFAR